MARVLVVDDDKSIPKVLCRALQRRGHDATGVNSVAEAWQLLEAGGWTHLLTDARLPGEGGLALASRAQTKWPELHIVIMSGSAPDELALPPNVRHICKPFQVPEALVALGLPPE